MTTYTYAPTTGYLQTVAGPVANSTTTYGYDGYGRVNSVTEPDGEHVPRPRADGQRHDHGDHHGHRPEWQRRESAV